MMWVRTYIAQLSATQAELLTETEHAALVTMATAEEHGETAILVHLSKGGGGNAGRGSFQPARKASRSQHVCSHVIKRRLCVDNSQLLYTTGSSPRHLYSRNSALRDGSCCDGGSDALCCGYPRLPRLAELECFLSSLFTNVRTLKGLEHISESLHKIYVHPCD